MECNDPILAFAGAHPGFTLLLVALVFYSVFKLIHGYAPDRPDHDDKWW